MSDVGKQILEFIKEDFCLVVEPSKSFASSLHTILHDLGIPSRQILSAGKFEEAQRLMEQHKPRILVTEFDLPGGGGLSLVEMQEKIHPDLARIAIVATKNSSTGAVAEAAEGQVDAFILKPFSADALKKTFIEVFQKKTNPTQYMRMILEGKEHLKAKNFDLALEKFNEAKNHDPQPTLACYYAGETARARNDIHAALNEFQQGRGLQSTHYKLLVGEFEAYMDLKKYEKAYELVSLIRDHFPVTSHRLGQMFTATVFTKHFTELPRLFELYIALEHRTPYLTQLTSIALFTAGRFAMAQTDRARARTYFEMGLTATGRSLKFIEMIVEELLKSRAVDDANYFLSKVNPDDLTTKEYARLSVRVDELALGAEAAAEKGRKLVLTGAGDPDLFRMVVRGLALSGRKLHAESVILKALETHPDLRSELYRLLEENSRV